MKIFPRPLFLIPFFIQSCFITALFSATGTSPQSAQTTVDFTTPDQVTITTDASCTVALTGTPGTNYTGATDSVGSSGDIALSWTNNYEANYHITAKTALADGTITATAASPTGDADASSAGAVTITNGAGTTIISSTTTIPASASTTVKISYAAITPSDIGTGDTITFTISSP